MPWFATAAPPPLIHTLGIEMNIIQNVKEISDLIKKYNDQELYQKIVELREEILNLKEENLQLKERLSSIDQQSAHAEHLDRRGNVYYLTNDDGTENGPYCMFCWDYERKLVNLSISRYRDRSGVTHESYTCSICAARIKGSKS